MQLKIYLRKILFDTYTLNHIQLDLIYAQQQNDAPTI